MPPPIPAPHRRTSAPSTPLLPPIVRGECFGAYTLVERLGSGGMAEIVLARRADLPGFEKLVAIKRMLPQLTPLREYVDMFLDEARLAALLHHPNLVHVHEVGVVDGVYFIAMEYLRGRDLKAILGAQPEWRRTLSIDDAVNVAMGVCAALQHAHELRDPDGNSMSVVHRDVSLRNITVTDDGAVKLLDFGIAKATSQIAETRAGMIKGNIPYMSPEQCRGEPLDRRSDIFSVGVVLYEMTVGRRLFRGANDFEVVQRIVDGRIPRPREVVPSYPEALEEIVMHALERDPQQRFQTAMELEVALDQLAREARLFVAPSSLRALMRKVATPVDVGSAAEVTATARCLATMIKPDPPQPDTRLVSPPHRRRRMWAAIGVASIALAAGICVWRSRDAARAGTESATVQSSSPTAAPTATEGVAASLPCGAPAIPPTTPPAIRAPRRRSWAQRRLVPTPPLTVENSPTADERAAQRADE